MNYKTEKNNTFKDTKRVKKN